MRASLALFALVAALAVYNAYAESVINQKIIDEVNSGNSAWIAGTNERFAGVSVEEAKNLMGTILRKNNLPKKVHKLNKSLPKTFDARQEWPNCIHAIRNQEQCGSCWAFAAAESLSDRLCIASNGNIDVVLSPEDLVSCDTSDMGCNGGYIDNAWQYMVNTGIVEDSCFPYAAGNGNAPSCPNGQCPGTGQWKPYNAKNSYDLHGVNNIMQEIYTNGPVEAGFSVYQDFMSYTSGVYSHKSGSLLGGHAIKIIGWGTENGQDYWLVANSWGPSWGLQGYFKILRGSDECGIEDNVVAGLAETSEDADLIDFGGIFHDSDKVLSDSMIHDINRKQNSWKAARNSRFEEATIGDVRSILGVRTDKKHGLDIPRVVAHADNIASSFDARTQWPNCIGAVRNQEQCGSCWAFGATESLADRYCIASGASANVPLSPEYLVSCDSTDYGCNGGYLENAWNFMASQGVVSDSCFPYAAGSGNAPACPSPMTCQDGSTPTYTKAKSVVSLTDVASIQTAIQTDGPVETGFSVYQDFMSYTSGVYQHTTGSLLGGHAVKIVGWGVDSGTDYWIVANSWGTSWGIDGFFWILRGADECGIESGVVVGQAVTN